MAYEDIVELGAMIPEDMLESGMSYTSGEQVGFPTDGGAMVFDMQELSNYGADPYQALPPSPMEMPQIARAVSEFETLKTLAPKETKDTAAALVQMKAANSTGDFESLLSLEEDSRNRALEIVRKQRENEPLSPGEQVGLLLATLLPVVAGAAISGKQGAFAGMYAGGLGGQAALATRAANRKRDDDLAMTDAKIQLDQANNYRDQRLSMEKEQRGYAHDREMKDLTLRNQLTYAQALGGGKRGQTLEDKWNALPDVVRESQLQVAKEVLARSRRTTPDKISDDEARGVAMSGSPNQAYSAAVANAQDVAIDDRLRDRREWSIEDSSIAGLDTYKGGRLEPSEKKVINEDRARATTFTNISKRLKASLEQNGLPTFGPESQAFYQDFGQLILSLNQGSKGFGRALTGTELAIIEASLGDLSRGTFDSLATALQGISSADQVRFVENISREIQNQSDLTAISMGKISGRMIDRLLEDEYLDPLKEYVIPEVRKKDKDFVTSDGQYTITPDGKLYRNK